MLGYKLGQCPGLVDLWQKRKKYIGHLDEIEQRATSRIGKGSQHELQPIKSKLLRMLPVVEPCAEQASTLHESSPSLLHSHRADSAPCQIIFGADGSLPRLPSNSEGATTVASDDEAATDVVPNLNLRLRLELVSQPAVSSERSEQWLAPQYVGNPKAPQHAEAIADDAPDDHARGFGWLAPRYSPRQQLLSGAETAPTLSECRSPTLAHPAPAPAESRCSTEPTALEVTATSCSQGSLIGSHHERTPAGGLPQARSIARNRQPAL